MTASGDDPMETVIRVLDAIETGALLVDRAGTVVHANACSCEMFRRSQAELVGRPIHECFSSPGARTQLDNVIRRRDEVSKAELQVSGADGTKLPVSITGRALAGPPSLTDLCVLTLVDMSSQKNSEEQYGDLARLSDIAIEQAIELKHYSEKLEDRVRQRTADLNEANMDAVVMLAVASEAKDADTGAHVRRVQHYCVTTARKLSLSAKEAEQIGYSSILHDVGKIHIPDRILGKPGVLTDVEREIMQTHTVIGEQILSKRPFFETARKITRLHHENWDGSGYPDGVAGEEIPLSARIVRAADVFDALTSERVYKPAWPVKRTVEHLNEHRRRMFDPDVVDAFVALVAEGAFNHQTKPDPDTKTHKN